MVISQDQNKSLNSVFTTNLPELLRKFNISLAVSTYQCGKLILIRRKKNTINTHFRSSNRPMGIANRPNRINIGAFNTIENYQIGVDFAIQCLSEEFEKLLIPVGLDCTKGGKVTNN